VAMKGKECVVIACDMRYGIRNQTVAMNFPKVFRMNSRVSLKERKERKEKEKESKEKERKVVVRNKSQIYPFLLKCYVGLTGLITDIQTVHERLNFRTQMYKVRSSSLSLFFFLSSFLSLFLSLACVYFDWYDLVSFS